jgi:hypothetical protein
MVSALTLYSVWCCELEFCEAVHYRFIIGGCLQYSILAWSELQYAFVASKFVTLETLYELVRNEVRVAILRYNGILWHRCI